MQCGKNKDRFLSSFYSLTQTNLAQGHFYGSNFTLHNDKSTVFKKILVKSFDHSNLGSGFCLGMKCEFSSHFTESLHTKAKAARGGGEGGEDGGGVSLLLTIKKNQRKNQRNLLDTEKSLR